MRSAIHLKNDKLHSLIGLARRARKLVLGSGGVENSVRQSNSKLVILPIDVAPNTRKRLCDKCSFYNVKVITLGTKDSLGKITGGDEVAAISVIDDNFAKALKSLYKEINGGGSNGET